MARNSSRLAGASVGIKELKDQASSIVEKVQRTRQPVTVTKNNRSVAQIVPIAAPSGSASEVLAQLGILSRPARQSWSELKLEKLGLDASAALAALSADREEG
jgi:prevent-host-death family protein